MVHVGLGSIHIGYISAGCPSPLICRDSTGATHRSVGIICAGELPLQTPSLASAKPRVDSRFSNYKPGCLFRYKQTGRFWHFLSLQHVRFRVRSRSGQVGDDVPRRWGFMVVSNNPGAICCRSRELQGGTGLRFGSGGFCVFQVPGEKEAKDSRSIFTERKKGGNK